MHARCLRALHRQQLLCMIKSQCVCVLRALTTQCVLCNRNTHNHAAVLVVCAGTDAAIEMQKRDSKKFNK